jgi:oxygen-independent coproporphyrinogen-3 oxidase
VPITNELLRKLDVPGPRYTSYPTVPAWTENFADHERALAGAGEPLSIYVHIPFCSSLCSYCGCNVVITRDWQRVDRYLAALEGEIAMVAARLGRRRPVTRIHFGGGTPTFLNEARLARLWQSLAARFDIARDAEVAIEVNPTGTRASQLRLLASLGFNRLSMGVQDFDRAVQDGIQRWQTVEETRATVETARAAGFKSINMDLIYGLPRQTPESFKRTFDQVVALRPERVAIFSFAYVPSARPAQKRLPMAEAPATAMDKLNLFLTAREALIAAGYRPIGMDHFALPDDELARAADRHALGRDFQGYTVERAPQTVGVGVSSISNLGDAYVQNLKSLGDYEAAVAAGRLPAERGIRLDADDQRRRDVITQIMCNFEVDLSGNWDEEIASLQPLADDGLVVLDGNHLQVTELGRLFVRNVAMVFDAYLRRDMARPFSRAV